MLNCIVSGSYGTIGLEICEGLAKKNFNVFMIGRHEDKLKQACAKVPNSVALACDLSTKENIEELARNFEHDVHLIVNCAACAPRKRTETIDGIEMQFAVNVLSYLWISECFEKNLVVGARIINVASYWAGGLDLDDLQFKKRKYDNDSAYRQSKQANRMLTVSLAERMKPKIIVVSCHPGDSVSKLSSDLGFGGHQTPAESAATPLFVATCKELVSGAYYRNCKIEQCEFSKDKEQIEKLYEICKKI